MAGVETNRTERERLLDPIDRISEILFGLIMALTFTCTLDAATADGAEVRSLLVAALGCNIAWGLVDGVMFATMGLVERAHRIRLLKALRGANADEGRSLIRASLSPTVASAFDDHDLDEISESLLTLPDLDGPKLRRNDVLGALSVATLVFLSTFPVAIPFGLIHDPVTALRTSNGVALVMLFTAGYALGRYAGGRPWRVGVAMALLGALLVVVTIALGG